VLKQATDPAFHDRAALLIATLRRKSPRQVAALMDLSASLVALNAARYAAWEPVATAENSKPAVLAFAGDVYEGLDAKTLSAADLAWAQRHVSILSGLYGLLRPLDRLQPYRLEMGTQLATRGAKDLYTFWGDRIAARLDAELAVSPGATLVNLASQEYSRAALRASLKTPVVECVFEEWRGAPGAQKPQVVSFYAKRARGLMARWVVQHRLADVAGLRGFDADGYRFDEGASSERRLVFRRHAESAGA
jgi:cytoplasmic iron level regulating protein YaaA (DUF328/UPF0246 family)